MLALSLILFRPVLPAGNLNFCPRPSIATACQVVKLPLPAELKEKRCPEARLAGGWDLDDSKKARTFFRVFSIYEHAALSLILFRPALPALVEG